MAKLYSLKRTLNEIVDKLLSSAKIKRLIFCDTADALERPDFIAPSNEDLLSQGYVSIFCMDISSIDPNKIGVNTNINIIPNNFFLSEDGGNAVSMSGTIYVSTSVNLLHLTSNRLRLLELVEEIDQILNNQKLSGSITLQLSSANFDLNYDVERLGYSIDFTIRDQQSGRAVI